MPLLLEPGAESPVTAGLPALADAVLHAELGRAPTVSLVLCDDAAIAELNERYLGHEGPTDVLTFPLGDPAPGGGEVDGLFGEIVVSLETAARQAAEFAGWPVERELALLLVHGLLHLCGWNDDTPSARKAMAAREDEHLAAAGLGPAPR